MKMIKQEILEKALRLAIHSSTEIHVAISGKKYEYLNSKEITYDENTNKPIVITIYPDSTYEFPNRNNGILETNKNGELFLNQINWERRFKMKVSELRSKLEFIIKVLSINDIQNDESIELSVFEIVVMLKHLQIVMNILIEDKKEEVK